MRKLCLIYNFAPSYRKAIFTAIDSLWDCTWFFGTNKTDIKGLDLNVLKNVETIPNKIVVKAPFYRQQSVVKKALNTGATTFFVLGDLYCLSTWILALRLKFSKKKLYYWTHGWYGKEGFATKIIKKLFFKLADGVFLYGNHARKLMIKEGFNPDKLFVIHNSLDHRQQVLLRNQCSSSDIFVKHFGNDYPVLLFIGRLTAVKKLDMLIDAVSLLHKSGVKCNLVLVGNGTESDKLKQLVNQRNISDYVWFYGACYNDTKNANLIYNADLCVAPGNVGLTAIHSMVFGTPVISHDDFKWQMPEFEAIRPGETGDFFKAGDVDSLAKTIRTWLETHTDRDKTRQYCYNEIDSYWTPEYQMEVLEKHLIVE